MILFYVVMFIAVVLIVAAVALAAARAKPLKLLTIAIIVIFVTGAALAVTAVNGVLTYRGYSHFDPEICAQVVWDSTERHWSCVTWEEAG